MMRNGCFSFGFYGNYFIRSISLPFVLHPRYWVSRCTCWAGQNVVINHTVTHCFCVLINTVFRFIKTVTYKSHPQRSATIHNRMYKNIPPWISIWILNFERLMERYSPMHQSFDPRQQHKKGMNTLTSYMTFLTTSWVIVHSLSSA
jgi:hypothetical protein